MLLFESVFKKFFARWTNELKKLSAETHDEQFRAKVETVLAQVGDMETFLPELHRLYELPREFVKAAHAQIRALQAASEDLYARRKALLSQLKA